MALTGSPDRPRVDLLVDGATEVLTVPPAGGLGIRDGAAVAIGGGRILGVGPRADLARSLDLDAAAEIRLAGGVIAPGFVDAHTHVVFGGSRVDEYAARVAHDDDALAALSRDGRTGIPATVDATRGTSTDALVRTAGARLREMLEAGTTTVESKSGYGLTVPDELRLLEINAILAAETPQRIVSTFLGAHDIPAGTSRATYVDTVVEEMLPEVARRGLATFCDVYCDRGYFDERDTARILTAGVDAGLLPKVHLDAYAETRATDVAIELGAVSVDHLNHTSDDAVVRLATAGIVGVGLPGLDLAVDHPRPLDLARLARLGLDVAVATDICPACWMPSMAVAVQLACRRGGLPVESATRVGAQALALGDEIGSLEPGYRADLQVWDLPDYRHLAYRIGSNPVTLVIAGGAVAVDRRAALR